jgi:hypothetical protein
MAYFLQHGITGYPTAAAASGSSSSSRSGSSSDSSSSSTGATDEAATAALTAALQRITIRNGVATDPQYAVAGALAAQLPYAVSWRAPLRLRIMQARPALLLTVSAVFIQTHCPSVAAAILVGCGAAVCVYRQPARD